MFSARSTTIAKAAEKSVSAGLTCEQRVQKSENRVMTKQGLAQECIVLCRFTIYSCILPHPQIQGEKPYDCLSIGVQNV